MDPVQECHSRDPMSAWYSQKPEVCLAVERSHAPLKRFVQRRLHQILVDLLFFNTQSHTWTRYGIAGNLLELRQKIDKRVAKRWTAISFSDHFSKCVLFFFWYKCRKRVLGSPTKFLAGYLVRTSLFRIRFHWLVTVEDEQQIREKYIYINFAVSDRER